LKIVDNLNNSIPTKIKK